MGNVISNPKFNMSASETLDLHVKLIDVYKFRISLERHQQNHEDMLVGSFDALVGRDEEVGLLLRYWE